MEQPISTLQQRTTSFNPEAAAFSPVFSSPIVQNTDEGPLASSTPLEASIAALRMAPMFNYSPFQSIGQMHSLYRRDTLSPAPVALDNFLSQALAKKLEEHPNVQEPHPPQTPTPETTQIAQVVAGSTPKLHSFAFPAQQPQPDYATVDIDELSAGLGLPAMKADTKEETSPAVSQKSRLLQAHPGALYGKLIGWALDKPLTAKGLAEYLQNQDIQISSEAPAPTTPSSTTNVDRQDTQPVRALTALDPTRNLGSAPDAPRATIPAPTETTTVPKGPSLFQHQHRRSSGHSSTSFQHHARNPSNRRYPRRASRAKRMDQGPMPSAADIYPDDANWTSPAPIYEGFDYMSCNDQRVEQPRVIVDNPFNWPTPAQVHEPYSPPTAEDMDAADNHVLALMGELPEPTTTTLVHLGAGEHLNVFTGLDLPCDSRALTPAQLDGSRYGMRFYGIAYGDQWELPVVNESEPFRVRPRDHDGWGGWEWALRKG